MEYMNLSLGLIILAVFGWLLVRNRKRTGVLDFIFRFDTLLGVLAGGYLVVSSLRDLMV